ncbi:MAG TPA: dehydrogenase, partial [Chryseosolibacter sp.]|nr:dehydrogenase [Chryseosolibacter sp.]
EQHIHNIDVMNWFKGAYPVKAQGMGGRQVRTGKEYGEIYDHHYVEFEYADGSILNSQCRHIKGTYSRVDEMFVGTKGVVKCGAGQINSLNGKSLYKFDMSKENQPYQNEHDELFAAIAKGEFKFANAEYGAKSTMTSIMGRMATYSGQVMEWDKVLNSGISIQPAKYDWDAPPPTLPDGNGYYAIATPGVTKYFS